MRLELEALEGLPEVAAGDAVAELVAATGTARAGDVLCISQKIVSKAEGRVRRLAEVTPSARARELAAELGKEPEMVELVLAESARIVRAERGVLITETHDGLICANAGIDASNVAAGCVTLLPADPDHSAREIRAGLGAAGISPAAVIVSDSLGRPWRLGQCEVAIGCAGIAPLADWRGRADPHGRRLAATEIALADQIAAAADLARDKLSRTPVVAVRGLERLLLSDDGPGARALRRPADEDLFR